MTMTRILSLLVALAVVAGTVPTLGQSPAAPPAAAPARAQNAGTRLPVRRVVLYKSGVGYFEHLGRVSGAQTVSIDLTSGQLDDVLKSLTTVDLGGGQVTGVTYNTATPFEEQLRTLRLPLDAEVTRTALLEALRGARVEVSAGGAVVSGRILSITQQTRGKDEDRRTVDELSIVTSAGTIRAFDLVPGVGVTLVEDDLRRDIGQYLDVVGSARAQNVRRLQVAARGTGERDLFVSYVSAVPVWKTTYRLVVPSAAGRKPFLQGWAIVDNTLGEDWSDVELSLVAGAPQSFVQPLSRPIYTRRPEVPIQTGILVAPEVHVGAMREEVAVSSRAEAGAASGAGGGMAYSSAPARRASEGTALIARPMPAPPPPPASAPAMTVEDAMANADVAATGADLGELFEYKLKQPVTIRRNQSALVPVVQHDVAIERVSLWSASRGVAQPMRAIWLTNDTGLTLDGGSVTLVEGNAFAGEGLVETIKPGEKRFVSYAMDLGVRVTAAAQDGTGRVSRIRIASGVMTQSVEQRSSLLYTVRNDDATARDVVIEHPARPGWKLTSTEKPAESTAAAHRFRVAVAPKSTATLTVAEAYLHDQRIGVTNISDDQIALILRGKNVAAGVEPQLRAIAAQSRDVTAVQRAIADRQAEVRRIGEDQARVRENLKALKGSEAEKALIQRYTTQLGTQEDRLDVLRRETETAEADRAAKQLELTRLVNALSVDVEMP